MDLFGRKRIALLESQLADYAARNHFLEEQNHKLLCKINPHLESVFFPRRVDELRLEHWGPTPDQLKPVSASCSLQMGETGIRFCATHKQDLDSQGRCPVTEITLYRKRTTPLTGKGRRILGSEFCRSRDEKFEPAEAGKET